MTLAIAQRDAKGIVWNAVARAYGFKRTDDRPDDWCPECRGDGCKACSRTGFKA